MCPPRKNKAEYWLLTNHSSDLRCGKPEGFASKALAKIEQRLIR